MNPLVQALKTVVKFLEARKIPYMVIGGIANTIYGNPRQTFDIDIKILPETDEGNEALINQLESIAHVVPEEPKKFIQETNVLPVDVHNVRVDLILATLPYEKEAIKRSEVVGTFGFDMKVCQPEDLIIQKAVSKRMKDWMDIETVIQNQCHHLDRKYLLSHCKELSEILNDPTIYDRIREWLSEGSLGNAD